jgi:homoserine kinase
LTVSGQDPAVRVRVPATTANLGPGFDCLGMAVQIYNALELRTCAAAGVQIQIDGTANSEDVPRDGQNLVYRAVQRVAAMTQTRLQDMCLRLTINAPLARGLGSSASAIVSGMLAANALAAKPLSRDELLHEMVLMEGHPDNIVPCYFGGLTASLLHDGGVMWERYEPHWDVRCVLFIPDYELSTAKAREALPKHVALRDAVFNLARVPIVIAKMVKGDLNELGIAMEDRLHQPHRKELIRESEVIIDEAERAGAAAVCLSGAGPAMLAIATIATAEPVACAWKNVMEGTGLTGSVVVTAPANEGATVELLAT